MEGTEPRLPGAVRSDGQAFRQIEDRFVGEVGGILARIDFEHGPVPFWALARMMFPVAESLGDLVYRHSSTADNLRAVLESEFEQVRTGYRNKAALLALLYRHSLTHHDELRAITSAGMTVGWKVTSGDDDNHLTVAGLPSGARLIEFQPRGFFTDIREVCHRARRREWGGEVMRRYNSWLLIDLESIRSTATVKAAKRELATL